MKMNTKDIQTVTEAPPEGSVSNGYFFRMLSPPALGLAAPYFSEESEVLENCLRTHSNTRHMNFIAVGGGQLWGLGQAMKYTKRYVCIEPLTDAFLSEPLRHEVAESSVISCIAKRFEDVKPSDLPAGNSVFMLLFNIMAYLKDPLEAINAVIKPGDILFISTWADTAMAKAIRTNYFNYLNSFEEIEVIDPKENIGLCHFDNFPFDELRHFERSERFKGAITDIQVIYV